MVIDTSPLFALFDRRDQQHDTAVRFVQSVDRDLITTWPVITEVVYLLRSEPRLQTDFLRWVLSGALTVVDVEESDLNRVVEVMEKYADLPADFADATLVAIADRLGIREIVTFDSDFDIYRRADGTPFAKLPLLTHGR